MISAEAIKARIPLNFGLMSNPLNWIILFFMIAIAGLAISLIYHPLDQTGD